MKHILMIFLFCVPLFLSVNACERRNERSKTTVSKLSSEDKFRNYIRTLEVGDVLDLEYCLKKRDEYISFLVMLKSSSFSEYRATLGYVVVDGWKILEKYSIRTEASDNSVIKIRRIEN